MSVFKRILRVSCTAVLATIVLLTVACTYLMVTAKPGGQRGTALFGSVSYESAPTPDGGRRASLVLEGVLPLFACFGLVILAVAALYWATAAVKKRRASTASEHD